MEDWIYFTVRYIPFWSVPLLLISAQFGHIYWLKEVRWITLIFISIGSICIVSLLYYMFAGSPHEAAALIRDNIFR